MWSDNLNKVALCFRLLCGLLFSFTCSTRNFNSIFFKNLNILVTPSSLPFFSSLPTSTNFYQLLSILFKYPRDSFFFSSILFLITNFYQLLSIFLHLPLFLFSSTLLIRPHSLYLLTYTSRTHYSMQKSSSRKAQKSKDPQKKATVTAATGTGGTPQPADLASGRCTFIYLYSLLLYWRGAFSGKKIKDRCLFNCPYACYLLCFILMLILRQLGLERPLLGIVNGLFPMQTMELRLLSQQRRLKKV